jgi:hypothetical protein
MQLTGAMNKSVAYLGGLGASGGTAPAHSGYLIERWPLAVVRHEASVEPDAWKGLPEAGDGKARPVAPYQREVWLGASLRRFFTGDEGGSMAGEGTAWSDTDKAEFISCCIRTVLSPYYTLIEAKEVARRHRADPLPDGHSDQEPIRPIAPCWGARVKVEGLTLDSFMVIRSPVESGDNCLPKLRADRVIRHPVENSAIILSLDPAIINTASLPPLIHGMALSGEGLERFVWPTLACWRKEYESGRYMQDVAEALVLPERVAIACRKVGVDLDLALALYGFLRSCSEVDSLAFIADLADELLASEVAKNAVEVGTDVSGLGQQIPNYVWDTVETLNPDGLEELRDALWLFDHNDVIAMFQKMEEASRGDKSDWAAYVQGYVAIEAGKEAKRKKLSKKDAKCWVQFRGVSLGTDDPEALVKDNLLLETAYKIYDGATPLDDSKISVTASRDLPT